MSSAWKHSGKLEILAFHFHLLEGELKPEDTYCICSILAWRMKMCLSLWAFLELFTSHICSLASVAKGCQGSFYAGFWVQQVHSVSLIYHSVSRLPSGSTTSTVILPFMWHTGLCDEVYQCPGCIPVVLLLEDSRLAQFIWRSSL